ncbi:MAG: threonine synthase [bacterium]
MSLLTHLECSACGAHENAARVANVCVACGGVLLARYDLAVGRRVLARGDLAGRPRSLWRLRELLPPSAPAERVTLGEGGTPLLRARRLERACGHEPVFIKDEAVNPTQSFKARGMAMAVTCAIARGVTRFAVPSAGNAGGALAAYAARAGAPAIVVLPSDTPRAFITAARLHGAHVELVEGHIGDAGRRVAALKEEGWFDVSTMKEPYRVEGKKTLGFEIVEDLGFRYPDWIVYPTGGGTGLVGMWKAFAELEAIGWVSGRRPRMVSVQTEGCAPVVDAFRSGAADVTAPERPTTRVYGLRVPKPFAGRLILAAIRESGGTALAVSENAIAEGTATLPRLAGIDAAPEGGAAWAGFLTLLREKRIARGDTVVVVNTGAGVLYRDGSEEQPA